jgi:hypothetical protein
MRTKLQIYKEFLIQLILKPKIIFNMIPLKLNKEEYDSITNHWESKEKRDGVSYLWGLLSYRDQVDIIYKIIKELENEKIK